MSLHAAGVKTMKGIEKKQARCTRRGRTKGRRWALQGGRQQKKAGVRSEEERGNGAKIVVAVAVVVAVVVIVVLILVLLLIAVTVALSIRVVMAVYDNNSSNSNAVSCRNNRCCCYS